MAKRKTTVGTTVSRVIEDDRLPDSVKTGVTRSIIQGGDMVEHVLDEMVSSIGLRAERMYEYAKNGGYTWGVPTGQFYNGESAYDEVSDVLAAIEGTPVVLDYVHHGTANNLHLGWMQLIALHGYNPATNQLTGLSATHGTTVWLKDMQVVIPSADVDSLDLASLRQWGVAAKAGYTPQRSKGTPATRALIRPTPVRMDSSASIEYLKVIHTRQVSGSAVEGSFTIPLPIAGYADDAEEDRDYFHVRYTVGGVVKYWIYEDGLGTYPTLDGLFDREPGINGTFFPFLYFRYNKESEVDDTGTSSYLTSKKLAKYLGIDYDQVGNAINDNPDIDDVEQAMIMFAVPGNTSNSLEQRYLFEFFENMYYANPVLNRYQVEMEIDIADRQANSVYLAAPGLVIQDSRFKMALRNDRIFKRKVPGSIGPVGTYASGYTSRSKPMVVMDIATDIASTISSPTNYHYYQRQVSTGFYEEIQVVDLSTIFFVFGQYKTIGEDTDKIQIIPVDRSITSNWSILDRELLYARSLHYVFNSRVVTKVKWYQTGIFKALMIVVAIVITVMSGGATVALAGALLASGSYLVAAALILDMVLVSLVFSTGFKLFTKAVGAKIAFIVAIVAAVAGASALINAGGLSGTPFATDLLQISSGLVKSVQDQLLTDIQGLFNQATEFEAYQEAKLKVLESAKDLLENNNHLSPFVIFGEKPEDFYNRTVHSGNIGVIGGIDSVSSFVDLKLSLPKLQDSLFGGTEYVWKV